ncbi:MAG TPA: family 1 glycosylhydrolase [Acidimicrobiales bacterium]|jgi:beta-glucosidase/6-phospho-beta-glucosidase/beta-galactosidase|nr:family 1 glycosylhydrolase [Acidimicrobiales bacterium]
MRAGPEPSSPDRGDRAGGILPEGFHFGVATAGFQVEGGFNGPGEPGNNWLRWEQVGRVEPSGNAVGFWDRPEEALDRAAGLGCDSFRLGLEWARVEPRPGEVDDRALAGYGEIIDGCIQRGLEPLVTLHHFTHPSWLGEDFWLRPDSPERFLAWVEIALAALAGKVRLWVTINEINVLAIESWLLGSFPPGRFLAFGDAAVAADHLLAAHVLAYQAIHRARPDAVVTTNNACVSVYDFDRRLTDILMARSLGVARHELGGWIDERRAEHDAALPPPGPGERGFRRLGVMASPFGRGSSRAGAGAGAVAGTGGAGPHRAIDAVYASPHPLTLDVVGLDYYDPMVARHFRAPGHRTAGGRGWLPARELWDDVPDPAGLTRWLGVQASATPETPLWVVENGLCNRVRNGRSFPRLDGWDRSRYLRENIGAVVAAIEAGVPVAGYWHWSLVDNYEWGSYQPRFGLYGVDRHRGERGFRWLETDSMGDDAGETYRRIIAGLRAGDRSVLDADPADRR